MAMSWRRHGLAVVALAVGGLPAAGGAQVPADDAGTRVLAGVLEFAIAGDAAAAGSYLFRHAAPAADRAQLAMDLRNLVASVRRGGSVRQELVYRVGEEVFVLLSGEEGKRYQLGVEMSADEPTIMAFRYFSGWWPPADSPLVLGSAVIHDSHWTGIPPDLAELSRGLGLYEDGDESRLAEADVRWAVEADRAGRPELRMVTDPPDAALLVVDVPGLEPGPAVTIARNVTLSDREPAATFQLGGRVYSVELTYSDPHLCDAVVTLAVADRSQVLYRGGEFCDEPHFGVEWAGDLDGDGRLDLVVNLSPKYSVFPAALLLSSAAGPGELVGEVARHVHVGL